MVENLDFNSLFGSEFADAKLSVSGANSERTVDPNLYAPKLDDANAKKGTYTALIRLLPNAVDYNKSILRKITYFFKDVNGENGVYVDSPETVGRKCPIGTLRARLWKTDDASKIAIAKENAGKQEKYWSLAYIIKDPQHPEYEGRVMVFRFGKKIYDKYMAASTKNQFDDSIDEAYAANHIINGKNLYLEIKSKDGYTNYDDSRFESRCPLKVKGVVVGDTEEGRRALSQIYASAPDMADYEYKEWDESTMNKVLANIKSYEAILPGVSSFKGESNPVENVVTQKYEHAPAPAAPTAQTAPKPAAPKPAAPKPTGNGSGDLFDEIDDLDL